MKKKKLKIQDLQVKSFITAVEDQSSNTVKGGFGETNGPEHGICENTIYPDASYCNPACLSNFPPYFC